MSQELKLRDQKKSASDVTLAGVFFGRLVSYSFI